MSAYSIYSAYLGELRAAVEFCRISAQLKPRLNDYLRWETADNRVRTLFQQFLGGQPNERIVYQSAVVTLHSGFEQFILDLVDDAAEAMTSRNLDTEDFEAKFPGVVMQACVASGHALASMFQPRSHWRIDYDELIGRLATARTGAQQVAIYGRPFGVRKASLSCDELEKLMQRLGFTLPWSEISRDASLQKMLGVSTMTAAARALKDKIDKVLSLRNDLAHSQGADDVSYEELVQFIEVYQRFSALLEASWREFVEA